MLENAQFPNENRAFSSICFYQAMHYINYQQFTNHSYNFMRIKTSNSYNFMRIKSRQSYNFMRITPQNLQQPRCDANNQRQNYLNALDNEKILLALGEKGNCAVSVLNDAISEQRAEGHHTVTIKNNKNEMRS